MNANRLVFDWSANGIRNALTIAVQSREMNAKMVEGPVPSYLEGTDRLLLSGGRP
jgi:hypothetical protein